MSKHLLLLLPMLLMLSDCAPKKRNAWDDIDYSKVRNRQARENDAGYVPPSIANCVDDDLYNCR